MKTEQEIKERIIFLNKVLNKNIKQLTKLKNRERFLIFVSWRIALEWVIEK